MLAHSHGTCASTDVKRLGKSDKEEQSYRIHLFWLLWLFSSKCPTTHSNAITHAFSQHVRAVVEIPRVICVEKTEGGTWNGTATLIHPSSSFILSLSLFIHIISNLHQYTRIPTTCRRSLSHPTPSLPFTFSVQQSSRQKLWGFIIRPLFPLVSCTMPRLRPNASHQKNSQGDGWLPLHLHIQTNNSGKHYPVELTSYTHAHTA